MLKTDKMFPFEGPRTIIILDVIFIYLMMLSMDNAQLTFQLMDSEINEVVFVDETNITFRCSSKGSETIDVTVRIEDPDGNTLTENNQEMYVEYTIQRVTMADGGVYTCKVTNMCVDGDNVTATASLLFNVQDNSMPRCVRNGTMGQPYKPGEWLLLSCYCREGDECMWFSTVEGTGRGHILTSTEEIESIGGKKIIRLLVNYTSNTDNNNNRYDCRRTSSERCSIGPLVNSSNDVISKSMTNTTSTGKCVLANTDDTTDSEMLSETTEKMTVTVSSQAANQNTSDSTTTILVIGGAVGMAVFLLVIVVVSFICISKFGRKKSNPREKDENTVHDDNYNDVDRGAVMNKAAPQGVEATGNGISSGYYQVTDENSLYDEPPMNNFMPDNTDGENYTLINRSRLAQQPASEEYGEEHTVLSRSERELPPADTMNLKEEWNHDQSETSTVDGNLQLEPSVPDSVVYAQVDTSKSSRTTKQSKVTPQINNEVPVIYAAVARKSDRIT